MKHKAKTLKFAARCGLRNLEGKAMSTDLASKQRQAMEFLQRSELV
jgi:hypothetical protein